MLTRLTPILFLITCGYFDPDYQGAKKPPIEVKIVLNEEKVDDETEEEDEEEEEAEEEEEEELPDIEQPKPTQRPQYFKNQIEACNDKAKYMHERMRNQGYRKGQYGDHFLDASTKHKYWYEGNYIAWCNGVCTVEQIREKLIECEESLEGLHDTCISYDHPEGKRNFYYNAYQYYQPGGIRFVSESAAWLCDGEYNDSDTFYSIYPCLYQDKSKCTYCKLSEQMTQDLKAEGKC